MRNGINDLLFWVFAVLLICAFAHCWHVLMTGNIPESLHARIGQLIFRAFALSMLGISAFMQKEFRNRVIATLLSIMFVPVIILYFAIQYHFYGIIDPMSKYYALPHDSGLADIYFSVITFTTTGYGDISPASMSCRAVAALEAFMGYGYGAFLIASAIDLLARARLQVNKELPSAANVPNPANH